MELDQLKAEKEALQIQLEVIYSFFRCKSMTVNFESAQADSLLLRSQVRQVPELEEKVRLIT